MKRCGTCQNTKGENHESQILSNTQNAKIMRTCHYVTIVRSTDVGIPVLNKYRCCSPRDHISAECWDCQQTESKQHKVENLLTIVHVLNRMEINLLSTSGNSNFFLFLVLS